MGVFVRCKNLGEKWNGKNTFESPKSISLSSASGDLSENIMLLNLFVTVMNTQLEITMCNVLIVMKIANCVQNIIYDGASVLFAKLVIY